MGHTISEALGDQTRKLNVLMIKRGSQLITVPHFQEVIQATDELVIVGADDDIESFAERNPDAARPQRLTSPLA